MNIKSKKITTILAILTIVISALFVFSLSQKQQSIAYGATTPKYTVRFDYEFYDGSLKTKTGTSVTSTPALESATSETSTFKINMFGSSVSGSGTLVDGGGINSSSINIETISSFYSQNIEVKNSIGSVVGTSTEKAISLSSLANGTYNVVMTAKTSIIIAAGGGIGNIGLRINTLICKFSFIVDTTTPTISGASTSTIGKYTNTPFTINASDTYSGVASLYMQAPNSNSYVYAGMTSKTVSVGSVNGLYRFYAVDKAKNESSVHYVYYDNILPIGTINSGSGIILTESYTNKSFNYTATDNASGVSSLQYKTPSSSAWTNYISGANIIESATNGLYSFQATDKCGNVSVQKNIYLDTIKPTITLYGGSSIIQSGGSTTASYLSFIGNDNLSGIKTMFIKAPGSSVYSTFSSGAQFTKDGIYYLYCEDNAGNISSTYTVNLDKTIPILSCEQTEFFKTYSGSFTVTSSDNNASVKLYYKTPTMDAFALTSSTEYTVGEKDKNGKYYFYCEDSFGNRSSTVWVELNVKYPEAQIIRSDTDNSVYITWEDDTYVVKLNGEVYKKGTVIRNEGNYNFTVTNSIGLFSTYNFMIGHKYILSEQQPTCTEQGYIVNKCLSCENSFHSDFTSALGHKYVESLVTASCTEGGCRRNTCSKCEDFYEMDNVPALGHQYFEEAIIATCTQSGCIKHTCNVCKYEYQTDIIAASGHGYISEVIKPSSCTLSGERNHMCEKCGDNYITEIPTMGHNYMITDVIIENGESQRTYTCSVCLDSYIQDLGNQYEHVTSYVEYLFNQYSPYMVWVLIATAGVWSIFIGVSIIIACKNEEKQKAKRMLINYGIGMVVIFAILVACPFLIRGIAILVS